MNKDDLLEIEEESNDSEIQKALIKSKKEIELGEIGTENDILRILQGNK